MSNSLLIDLNRGVIIQKHRKTGMHIYMYVDAPGEYLNAFGKPVPESIAKEAGFEVGDLARKRAVKQKIGAAMAAIEDELGGVGSQPKVLAERGGYRVIELGLGRARVEDNDGNVLTETPIPADYALKLLDELVPAQEGEVDKNSPARQNAKSTSNDKKEKSHGGTAS